MAPKTVALPPALPSELLTYILTYPSPSTLIVCKPRSSFLSSLIHSINISDAENEADHPAEGQRRHPLLIPTLRQIDSSRGVKLVFVNTVSHLRAYLGAFPPPGGGAGTRSRPGPEMILVYGMVGLHRDTSEWSAQGLGNSAAMLVEAGWRSSRRIALVEEKMTLDGHEDLDLDGRAQGWEERVPMLNGNMRRAGIEGEAVWSGRTVEVRRVLGRWFKFRKGGWGEEE